MDFTKNVLMDTVVSNYVITLLKPRSDYIWKNAYQ